MGGRGGEIGNGGRRDQRDTVSRFSEEEEKKVTWYQRGLEKKKRGAREANEGFEREQHGDFGQGGGGEGYVQGFEGVCVGGGSSSHQSSYIPNQFGHQQQPPQPTKQQPGMGGYGGGVRSSVNNDVNRSGFGGGLCQDSDEEDESSEYESDIEDGGGNNRAAGGWGSGGGGGEGRGGGIPNFNSNYPASQTSMNQGFGGGTGKMKKTGGTEKKKKGRFEVYSESKENTEKSNKLGGESTGKMKFTIDAAGTAVESSSCSSEEESDDEELPVFLN